MLSCDRRAPAYIHETICQVKVIGSDNVTRAYEQKARAESAAETRRRILDGVYECLREEPSTRPSLGEIACRADVARSTVYLVFGSRAGLFDAFAEELWQRSGLPHLQEAVNVPDARQGPSPGSAPEWTSSPRTGTSSTRSSR